MHGVDVFFTVFISGYTACPHIKGTGLQNKRLKHVKHFLYVTPIIQVSRPDLLPLWCGIFLYYNCDCQI